MFDDVRYESPCPICGTTLTMWQSKSGGCGLQVLTPRELWDQRRDDRIVFYDNCDQCGTWVEITVRSGSLPYTDEDYARMWRREPVEIRRGPVVA